MYKLSPPYVLMLDEVRDDPLMWARAQRILDTLPRNTPVHVISLEDLPAIAQERGWHELGGAAGLAKPARDPVFFFGKMRWDGRWEERWEAIRADWPAAPGFFRQAYGYDAFSWFLSDHKTITPCPDHVCRPAWRINLVWGCPHRCCYCGLVHVMTFMMNVEEYIGKLAELSRKNPWQKTWLYEDDAEALAPEPEYGGLPAIMDFCARSDDNYVIVHTKSANVDWMRDLPHNGRTILVWSLTAQSQSTLLEPRTATTEERIEAAAKCHAWGYPTRFKFKPIIPVVGWRDELAEMIKQVFARTHPDVISLFSLAWMSYSHLTAILDTKLLDPEFLSAAEQAVEAMGETKVRPFPHEMRKRLYEFCIAEVRRYDPDIPISLCTETLDMWRELGPVLGLNPASYPCGCGPTATPGLARLSASPWAIARPVPVEGDPAPLGAP